MKHSMWNKIYNWFYRRNRFELWVKVPMTCESNEDKTDIILTLMDLLERNIKVKK
jgi:putative NIF3 family GTP cyclohydrolase 1 type 2